MIAGGIVFGHLAAIALRKEVWPLSHYPMYRNIAERDTVRVARAYAVRDGREVELGEEFFGSFFSVSGFMGALRGLSRAEQEEVVRDWVRLKAPGPASAMDQLRIYLVEFAVVPYARNRDEPSGRELAYEFTLGDH